jgi:hypothetical protein
MRQTIEKDGVRMKVSDASRLSVVRSCLHTPLAILLAAGALYGLAEIFYSNFVDQLLALLLFVATCLVIFHLVFWLNRRWTDDRGLKATDYVYLGMAFFGVLSVLDVQASIATKKLGEILRTYDVILGSINPCIGKESSDCNGVQGIMRLVQTNPPNPSLKTLLKWAIDDERSRTFPKEFARFYATADQLVKELERDVIPFVEFDEKKTIKRRFMAFYVLSIGLALRSTRVTAELASWQKKPLPTSSYGDHNIAWLRRKLARLDARVSRRRK